MLVQVAMLVRVAIEDDRSGDTDDDGKSVSTTVS
jgi:hypothetical protein